MIVFAHRARASRVLAVAALGLALTGVTANPAFAAQAPVGLGTAASFAVLAGTTITNTGPSVISGDVGLSPGTAVVGFPPGTVNNGTIHATDATAAQAEAAVTTAYNDAAGRAATATISADLGGRTLVSGVYTGATLGLTGTLTLDAQGDPNAVFVFQSASTLITASASVVALTNGATACNVFWQVGSSATLGTNSTFVGTVLALTSIAATTGTNVNGRVLARNGAVTLDSNTITNSTCGGTAPTTTTIAATTTAPTTTTTALAATTTAPTSSTTTTVPTTTTTAGATATTQVPTTPAVTPSVLGGGLPRTGHSSSILLLLAFSLVAAGAILVAVRRRHT